MAWCRNEGEKHKTIFWGEQVSETENIGILCVKPPYFRGRTLELYTQEVRCFWFPDGRTNFRSISIHLENPVSAEIIKNRNNPIVLDTRCLL